MAELVVSEFAQLPQEEELIEESRSNTSFDTSASKINQELGLLSSNVNINTNNKEQEIEDLNLEMSQETAMNLQREAEKFGSDLGIDQIVNDNESKLSTDRTETINYKVKPGDTVSTIANKFGISINTILWENNLSSRGIIHPGDSLSILPVSGINHSVKSGENISYIANKYDVSANKILEANNISNVNSLKIGQNLIIPGASKINTSRVASTPSSSSVSSGSSGIDVIKDLIKPKPASSSSSETMQWPTVGHRITQYYSWRHTGLDIANKTGTPLYASEDGTIEYSGWSTGYGYNVLINHGGGKKTRYAHASKLYVKKGDTVKKGESVAAMGSTGWSTGPHIHFEVIINGVKLNPLNYIR